MGIECVAGQSMCWKLQFYHHGKNQEFSECLETVLNFESRVLNSVCAQVLYMQMEAKPELLQPVWDKSDNMA